jgi:hypothetical protein
VTQSGWIAAALIAGFLLWLALQNRLGAYWSILSGGGGGGSSGAGSGNQPAPLIPAYPGAVPSVTKPTIGNIFGDFFGPTGLFSTPGGPSWFNNLFGAGPTPTPTK